MTQRSEHVEFETLNDYVDGRLDSWTIAFVDKHLAACRDCASELASLQDLVASTATLSRSVLPDDDLWNDLKAAIEDRKESVLPVSGRSTVVSGPWYHQPKWLTAAAIVLVGFTSMVTTVMVREPDRNVAASRTTPVSVLPASFTVAEGQYMSAIDELRIAVDAQRAQLSPETVRTVDHSLAVVDSAIAEAKAALLADPNNRTLVDLLSTTYQRKLDLLRRTSELTSKI